MSTLGCPSCERAHGTLRLLTLALLRLPELAVQAHLIDMSDAAPDGILDVILERTCATSAGALRLAHHALEAHAESLGYDADVWIRHAHQRARAALHELEPTLIEGETAVAQTQVRRAAVALTRAAAATAERRPDRRRRDRHRARAPADAVHGGRRSGHQLTAGATSRKPGRPAQFGRVAPPSGGDVAKSSSPGTSAGAEPPRSDPRGPTGRHGVNAIGAVSLRAGRGARQRTLYQTLVPPRRRTRGICCG